MYCDPTGDPNVYLIDFVYTSVSGGAPNSTTTNGKRSYGLVSVTNALDSDPLNFLADSITLVFSSTLYPVRPVDLNQDIPNVLFKMTLSGGTRRVGNELAGYTTICSGASSVVLAPGYYTVPYDIFSLIISSTTFSLSSSGGPDVTIFDPVGTATRTIAYISVSTAGLDYTFTGITFQNTSTGAFAVDSNSNTVKFYNCVFRTHTISSGNQAPVLFSKSTSVGASVSTVVRFDNCKFIGNSNIGGPGGVFIARGTMDVLFTNSYFDGNSASTNGGVGLAVDASLVVFRNCAIHRSRAGSFGGVVNTGTSSCTANITLISSTIEDSSATTGGSFAVASAATFLCSNLTVKNSFATQSSGFLSTTLNNVFTIRNSTFINGGALNSGSGFTGISGTSYGIVSDSIISNYSCSWTGGVFAASSSSVITAPYVLTVTNTVFQNNYGIFGGVFYLNYDRKILCDRCTFISNHAEVGGLGYFQDTSTLLLTHSKFLDNSALSGGCFYGLNDATAIVESSTFTSNSAADYGGVFVLTFNSSLTVTNSVFDGNSAIELGGVGSISDDSDASFTNVTFQNSLSRDSGGAIVARALSTLTINNCSFVNNRAFSDGGSIRASGSSSISITSSNFYSSNSQRGAGIALVGYASLTMSSSFISGNNASTSGGGLLLLDSAVATLIDCSFTSNRVAPTGYQSLSTVLALGSLSSASGNSLGDISGGGAAFLGTSSKFSCFDCIFTDNVAYGGYGGAVLVVSATSSSRAKYARGSDYDASHTSFPYLQADLISSNFTRNTASFDGGGLAVQGGNITITDCTFKLNTAGRNGGGIGFFVRANEPTELKLVGSTLITSNTAYGVGGGAYFAEGDSLVSTISISSGTYITYNTATSGGAYYLQSLGATPSWEQADFSSQVINNNATVYGSISASPPVEVSFIAGNDLPASISVLPGGVVPSASFHLLDTFSSVVAISDGTIEFALYSGSVPVSSSVAQFGGVYRRSVFQGIAAFSGISVYGTPGTYTLRVQYIPSTTSTIDPASVQFSTYPLTIEPCDGDTVLIYDSEGLGTCYKVFDRSLGLRYTFLGITVAGEILCLLLIVFVYRNRTSPPIRASSPRFMLVVIFGCMLAFALVGTMIPQASDLSCTVNIWVGHIAFSLAFGALFFRTYRIVLIFNNKKLKKQLRATSDQFLLSMVTLVVLAVIVYLIIWTAVDRHVQKINTDVNNEVRYLCASSSNIWGIALYIAEAALLLFGVVLAYKSRKAPTKYNESKFLAFAIWNIFAIVIIVLPLNYVVDVNNPDSQFLVTCVGVFLATFGTLFLSIIHKIYSVLYADPDEESTKNDPKESSSPSHSNFNTSMAIEMGGEKTKAIFSKLESDLAVQKEENEKLLMENKTLSQRIRELEAKVTLLLMDVAEAKRNGSNNNNGSLGGSSSAKQLLLTQSQKSLANLD